MPGLPSETIERGLILIAQEYAFEICDNRVDIGLKFGFTNNQIVRMWNENGYCHNMFAHRFLMAAYHKTYNNFLFVLYDVLVSIYPRLEENYTNFCNNNDLHCFLPY